MEHVNLLKIVLAALSSFMLGGLWYSKVMFLNVWAKESGLDLSGRANDNGRHPAMVFGIAYLLSFVSALCFSLFLGESPPFLQALCWSFTVGLVFVGGSFGINYVFGGNSLKLWLVNAGYHLVQFLLYGLVFGLWH